MKLTEDLPDLTARGIITEDQAQKIAAYYSEKSLTRPNVLLIIFGIIGAILVGLALVLIAAHNWDTLSRLSKTIIAFSPLVLSQILSTYTLTRKSENPVWKETSATLLFFSIATCIALVAQIYHIPDSGGTFYLTWIGLCIPVIYVLRSRVLSLLCILGITYYQLSYGYSEQHNTIDYMYYVYILSILPFYFSLVKSETHSYFTYVHHWVIALSLTICTACFMGDQYLMIFITYMALMTFFVHLGESKYLESTRPWANAYAITGPIGIIVVLLITSFSWYDDKSDTTYISTRILSREFMLAMFYIGLSLWLYLKKSAFHTPHLFHFLGVVIPFTLILLLVHITPYVLINILAFVLGIVSILDGVKKEKISALNAGLFIISALIICRFFDTDISFLVRGIVFLILGIGFFATNYFMIKKFNKNEN
jgi:uncharacterized membrane protein